MATKKITKHDPATCHCCGFPPLPAGVTEDDAAFQATQIYAGNAPADHLLAAVRSTNPFAITMLTSKWWGPKVDLSVKFLDTSNAALKAKILLYANKWNKYGNVQFRETGSMTADVRIATTPGDGHYAYLGTDMRLIPTHQKNMNLDSFSLATPDSEYDRVVCHEFGHAIGCPHEQSRPEILARLDRQKTYAFYLQRYGWGRQTVDQQIFTPLDPNSIWATAPDETSIMCYQFPGQCTKNGQPIPGGFFINELDGSLIAQRYPKEVGPTDPDPEEPKPVAGKLVIDTAAKTISAPVGWTLKPAAAGHSWVSEAVDWTSRLLNRVEELVVRYGVSARQVLKAARAFVDNPNHITASALWQALADFRADDGAHLSVRAASDSLSPRSLAWGDWKTWAKRIADLIAAILED